MPSDQGVALATYRAIDAVIFDMDGVITQTATVHSAAWKRMFDAFLCARSVNTADCYSAFSPQDYLSYVDGRPRYQGVQAFLQSRGIELPFGIPSDLPGNETICALGNRKNEIFNQIIEEEGVAVYESTLALIHRLRDLGVRVGLATSSRNSALILGKTGIEDLFETVVDGLVSEKLRLKGKPSPDIFTIAAFSLGVDPARSVVVEDAVSGVQAGCRGGFGLTVGIAREENRKELQAAGADLVVGDLSETHFEDWMKLVKGGRQS